MKWIITEDLVNLDHCEVGCGSFKGNKDTLPFTFRLLDGDNVVYFIGKCSDNNSQAAFIPLDTLGASYGCTHIEYMRSGKWEVL